MRIEARILSPIVDGLFVVIFEGKATDGSYTYEHIVQLDNKSYAWQNRSKLIHCQKEMSYGMVFLIFDAVGGRVAVHEVSFSVHPISRPKDITTQVPLMPAEFVFPVQYTTHSFAVQRSLTLKPLDVSIATQLSVDRFDRLQVMAQSWKGPISAAVYIKTPEDETVMLPYMIETN